MAPDRVGGFRASITSQAILAPRTNSGLKARSTNPRGLEEAGICQLLPSEALTHVVGEPEGAFSRALLSRFFQPSD